MNTGDICPVNPEDEAKTWAIYIDIEGFSYNYQNVRGRVIAGLGSLMTNLDLIGNSFCFERDKRLSAFQAGDSFFINSDYGSPDVPIAIAIILMRSALLAGSLTVVGISEGECVGISGWRPQEIRRKAERDCVRLGEAGHMYLFPVMGTAYIKAHTLTKSPFKGCLLFLDPALERRSSLKQKHVDRGIVDWIHADIPEIAEIANAAKISLAHQGVLEEMLNEEASNCEFLKSEEWLYNTLRFNHCEYRQTK